MKRFTLFACLALVAVFAVNALAADVISRPQMESPAVKAPKVDFAKAGRDTVYMLGAPGSWDGRFETPAGDPSWWGWYRVDVTAPTTQHWYASTYNAENLGGAGNNAAWCGADYPPCNEDDPAGGYGNSWDDRLNLWVEAPDPGQPTNITVNYIGNFDVEPDFDYVDLVYETDGGLYELVYSYTGLFEAEVGSHAFTVDPADYVEYGDMDYAIHIMWNMTSVR
jgi:hypothetical protein